MRTSLVFQPQDAATLVRFIRRQPLAIISSTSASGCDATALPLLAQTAEDGTIVAFIGHMALSNPHVKLLQENNRAVVVFLGEHGYISPSWMRDRTQAPTWNFEMANFIVELAFHQTLSETAKAVDMLVDAMEEGRPERWRANELGARYDQLIKHVIGFTANVIDSKVKFKMGQNERADVYADIIAALEGSGDHPLAGAMRRYNANR